MAITLIVEDGSRPAGANTYASAADADAYHADRAFEAWSDATDDEKATALIKATEYINGRSWMTGTQLDEIMAWPRTGAVAPNGGCFSMSMVPKAVIVATCYMAGEFLAGAEPLAAQDRPMTAFSVGSVSMTWGEGSNQAPTYPALRSILRGLIGSSNVIPLLRG